MNIIITEKQVKLIMENSPTSRLRRRLFNKDSLQDLLDYDILDYVNPCDWDNVGDFVGDICDTMAIRTIDYFTEETGEKLSPKESDYFYYYCLDNFGKYIETFYKKKCA
jgi:hypothetical protein